MSTTQTYSACPFFLHAVMLLSVYMLDYKQLHIMSSSRLPALRLSISFFVEITKSHTSTSSFVTDYLHLVELISLHGERLIFNNRRTLPTGKKGRWLGGVITRCHREPCCERSLKIRLRTKTVPPNTHGTVLRNLNKYEYCYTLFL